MKTKFLIFLVVIGLSLSVPIQGYGQSELPDNVKADLLRNQIVKSVQSRDLKSALVAIDKLKQLNQPFPSPFLLIEAKASYAVRDYGRAYDALKSYLKVVEPASESYNEAIGLYPIYEEAAKPILEQRTKAAADAEEKRLAKETERGNKISECENFKCYKKYYKSGIECREIEDRSCNEIYANDKDTDGRTIYYTKEKSECKKTARQLCFGEYENCKKSCQSMY